MTSSMGRMTSHIWHGKQTSCSKPPTSYDIPFIMVIYKSVLNPIKTPICCWFQTTNQLWLTSYFFSCRLSSPVGFPPRYLSFASSGVWPASLGAAVGTSSCSPFSVVEASATGQRWQGQIKQQNMPQKNKIHVDSSNTKCGAFNNRECEFQMISQVQKGDFTKNGLSVDQWGNTMNHYELYGPCWYLTWHPGSANMMFPPLQKGFPYKLERKTMIVYPLVN